MAILLYAVGASMADLACAAPSAPRKAGIASEAVRGSSVADPSDPCAGDSVSTGSGN